MDIAYDHVQEEAFSPSEPHPSSSTASTDQHSTNSSNTQEAPQSPNLNTEFQQAFQAVSSTPWGSTIGGWFSQARKQGESFYQDLQKEASEAQEQATKGFSSLREQVVSRTRSLSLSAEPGQLEEVPGEETVPSVTTTTAGSAAQAEAEALGAGEKPENLPADIVKEAGTLVASLRSTAALKLKDLQRAEDAADEALLKFGTNVRNFLRDAVVITAPTDADGGKLKGTDAAGNEVLFETQEPGTGKKVFHSTRLDAQLHAIHTTASSFTEDPAQGEQWDEWQRDFDVEKRTEEVARDLERYEELRRAMERLVPEKVEYRVFWMRYYFLRKAVEEEEKRRREVLKGAATNPEEEVGWDDDEEEGEASSTPNPASNKAASESTTTLNAPAASDSLKPKSPRRSNEDENKSVADSDASYDIVSGTTSRAAGSPKEEKRDVGKEAESDDDWE